MIIMLLLVVIVKNITDGINNTCVGYNSFPAGNGQQNTCIGVNTG